ncbi:GntR family transcriptional regulator [Solirubrobacter pauli]|uniref:GntR family transcriptional regulator n=1 Tax=Solirubrobacter pauli TaxID=166793 RepID=A0A660L5G1_9ACTN|nr:GntR family transcriptional regulator [Solirubrobacter pauli]RKQ86820.1 GntR family transcriptional regulator [Solirubrobacter pauli]
MPEAPSLGDQLLARTPTDALEVPSLTDATASVGQLTYNALRGAILAMDVYASTADLRLDEKRLAAELGVSRTPVREALARLEHEGLVRIRPRRGVDILRKSKAEVVEMLIAWGALEAAAARLACERASDAELRELAEPAGTGRLDEYSRENLRLHARIVELGHSTVLTGMADNLLAHVRGIVTAERDPGDPLLVDHGPIVTALHERDADRAERLVREHSLRLADDVEATITQLG